MGSVTSAFIHSLLAVDRLKHTLHIGTDDIFPPSKELQYYY